MSISRQIGLANWLKKIQNINFTQTKPPKIWDWDCLQITLPLEVTSIGDVGQRVGDVLQLTVSGGILRQLDHHRQCDQPIRRPPRLWPVRVELAVEGVQLQLAGKLLAGDGVLRAAVVLPAKVQRHIGQRVGVAEGAAADGHRLLRQKAVVVLVLRRIQTVSVVLLGTTTITPTLGLVLVVVVVAVAVVVVVISPAERHHADASSGVEEDAVQGVALDDQLREEGVVDESLRVDVHRRLTAALAAVRPLWVQPAPEVRA